MGVVGLFGVWDKAVRNRVLKSGEREGWGRAIPFEWMERGWR